MSLTANERKESGEVVIPQTDPKRRPPVTTGVVSTQQSTLADTFDEKGVSPEMLTQLKAFYNDRKKKQK